MPSPGTCTSVPHMGPAPSNVKSSTVPLVRKAAGSAAWWTVQSAPKPATAKRLPTSAATVPEVGLSPHMYVNRAMCKNTGFFFTSGLFSTSLSIKYIGDNKNIELI